LIGPLLRNPVQGKEFVESALRGLRDAAENIGEPGLRIDVVELGGADQRVDRGRPDAAAVGASAMEWTPLPTASQCAQLAVS